MKVFDFLDYKQFTLQELQKRPKKGHGQFLKIAKALNIHTTMVTHILKGHLHLGAEQCLALAEFLGLNELETDYFITLVNLARAGDQRTKSFYKNKIAELKEKALKISHRVEFKNVLDEKDQALYYSSWIYSAIRLLTAIPKFQDRNAIAQELKLPMTKVNRALDFLLSRGLCVEKNNKLQYGEVKTYLEASNPLVIRHHSNWRLKIMEQLEQLEQNELAFTNAMVISEQDYFKIREELVQTIERIQKISVPSPSEKLYCLNIDWVSVKK